MISFNKIIALTTATLFMTACTSDRSLNNTRAYQPTPVTTSSWQKEGVSESMKNDKVGHCKIEVGASRLSKEEAEKLVSYCMKADGYNMVTNVRWL
ncbi:hypothetical protein ACT3QO_01950 [Psychrobacter sp. AOP7-D1-15]|uniref:hypothetical protein n=1 Tax=unclassified Psychrobacter TaxID=196806 RepID=UPI001867187A|nr:hypothetical protein [Psychrobacter sp. FME61]